MTTARMSHRFSMYLDGQTPDSEVRRRLVLSAGAASLAVAGLLAFGWTAERLGLEAVSAPEVHQLIFLEVGTPPPPAPAPPPAPVNGGGGDPPPEEEPEPDPDPTPRERSELPDPHAPVEPTPSSRPSTSDRPGPAGGGDPLSKVIGAGGRCIVPPCAIGTGGIGTSIDTRRKPPPPPVDDPPRTVTSDVVGAYKVFAPDPDQKELQRTRTGVMGTARGISKVSFCIDKKGNVTDVRTSKKFGGDPEIDSICRATVKRWRFRAMMDGGRARKTCTTQTFVIEFE